jgi:hypothetical protein
VLGRASGCLAQCSCVAIADHSSDTRSLAESMRARLSAGMLSAVRGPRAPTVASNNCEVTTDCTRSRFSGFCTAH